MYFSGKAQGKIEEIIAESSGNEVFFVGSLDGAGLVQDVIAVARGNDFSVPAVVESARPGDVVIHNHPSGNLTPSNEDIHMASFFGNQGVGFYIVNNDATKVYVVVEPFPRQEIEKLDIDKLKNLLLPGSKIAAVMGTQYEERQEQIDMLEGVAAAFNDDLVSLIEAGTGTGKTLAYLLPSIHWSASNGERVVISTNTINLQEQLIEKDIPLVRRGLDEEFKYSLVKGMGNYLCLLRAETVMDGLFDLAEVDEMDTLKSVIEWSKVTQDGSLSDLNFNPSQEVWDKVSAESESCLRVRCPHYSKCFFFKARRELASAQILVVNHHLLFSDLSIKGAGDASDAGILPPYGRVIFDEAHHISEAATSHFGMRTTKYGIIRMLRRLKRRGSGGEMKGLIFYTAALATKLKKYYRRGIIGSVLRRVDEVLSPKVDAAEEHVRNAFDELYQFSKLFLDEKGESGEEINMRITEEARTHRDWEKIDKIFSILRIKLKDLHQEIKSFVEVLVDYETETEVSRILMEFRGIATKLDFYADVIGAFLDQGDDGYVRWVEGRVGKGGIVSGLGLSPLDISPHLKERLYTRCKTVVMTSATLAVRRSFEFLKSQLGLTEEERAAELIIPSPFNYEEQALVAIPKDIPEPVEPTYSAAIAPVIVKAVKASRGNALILFTSYYLLEKIYDKIRDELEDMRIVSLKQGNLPRAKLLDRFRAEDNTVLFATDSFWEGVDVPGEALRMVIITRLPFKVPTDPIIEARVEHMENQGLNSFLEYTIPTAVLKFKQGFGRLIRSTTDRGGVLVLDRRIVSKSYGKYFLESLPPVTKAIGRTADLMEELEEFFRQ